jgi:O-antigen/teichoic acid export membrane protein
LTTLGRRNGLGRATLVVLTGTSGARVLTLFAALVAASVLQAESQGLFAFYTVTASLLSSIGVMGSTPLITRAVAGADDQRSARGIGTLSVAGTATLIAMASALFIAAAQLGWLQLSDLESRSLFVLSMIALWAMATGVNQMLFAVVAGHKAFSLLTNLTIARAVIVGLTTAVFALVTRTPDWTTAGAATGESLVALVSALLSSRRGWLDWGSLGAWRSHGAQLFVGVLGAGVASMLVNAAVWGGQALLIASAGGAKENGGFSVSNRVVVAITLVPATLALTSLPYLARRSAPEAELRRRAGSVLVLGMGGAVGIAAVAAVFSSRFMNLVGPSFAAYGDTLVIMCVAAIAMSANLIVGSLIVAAASTRSWIVSDVVLAVALIALAYAFVPTWGANGLAWAYAASYASSVCVMVPALVRGYGRFSRQTSVAA